MVTKIKNLNISKKNKVTAAASDDVLNKKSMSKARVPRKTSVRRESVEDTAYTESNDATSRATQSAHTKQKISHLIAQGKDLMSGESTSFVAAAAIVVGAALIEVELIPGLIIGAGAILVGKLFPEVGDYVRPAIKGVLRAGFGLTHKVQEVLAETTEQVHDLVAEVLHEQMHEPVEKSISDLIEPATAFEAKV